MELQLEYSSLERRKERWVIEQRVDLHADWLPFHFAYADLFYGLVFKPVNLKWRNLQTVQDLFDLCLQLSLILWLSVNNQTEDPRGLAVELFSIPREFRTSDLPLQYDKRCSDPLTRITTFRPLALPLQYYSEEDCRLLLEWYGFEPSNYMLAMMGEGMLESLRSKTCMRFVNDNTILYKACLQTSLQIITTPTPIFNVTSRTSVLTATQYHKWEREWEPWIAVQLRRLMLCSTAVVDYMGAGYAPVNNYCRKGGDKEYNDMATKLNNLFTLTPLLPASLVVFRGLRGYKFHSLELEVPHIEHGFMSVSLSGSPVVISDVYLYLTLPAGIPILALLAVLNYQQELLLPPGTKYILRRRWKEGAVVKYEGEVLPM